MKYGLFALVVMSALITAGCQRAAQEQAPPPAAEGQVVNVVAKEFSFEPKEIRVKAGRVTFNVKNDGAVEHDFQIMGVAKHETEHGAELIKPGATYTGAFDLKPGTHEIVCGVAGHKEAGMTATLIVEP